MSSWEWKLEEFGIRAALAGMITIPCKHHDDPTQADNERIVFFAVTGEQDPPDSPVYAATLQVELRTTNRNAAQVDAIFNDIENAFAIAGSTSWAAATFSAGLSMDQEDSQDNRSDSKDTRKRSRTYKFHMGQTMSVTVDNTGITVDSNQVTCDAA